VAKRKELEAALAKAEAALANAVINTAKLDANRTEANANIDKIRAYCRRARAELIELKHSESTAGSGEEVDILIRQLLEVSKRGSTASPPSRQLSEHAVRGRNKRSQDESSRRKPIHRLNIGFSAQKPSHGNAPARPSLPRQAIGLLALILAYLQYFFLDVQLQILRLPSNFAGPLQ
jgi:hypothetical protein